MTEKMLEVKGYRLDKQLSFVTLTYRVKSHFMSVLGQRLLLIQVSADGAVSSLSDGKSQFCILRSC